MKMLCTNSDRFCKNPYFLHSIATSDHSFYANNCKIKIMISIVCDNDKKSITTKKLTSIGTLEANPAWMSKGILEIQNIKKGRKIRPMSAPKYDSQKLMSGKIRNRFSKDMSR